MPSLLSPGDSGLSEATIISGEPTGGGGGGLTPIANNTVLGNVSGSTAIPSAITPSQLTALNPPGPPLGTPPASPVNGQLFWDDVGGQLYVAYGGVWVAASCCAGGGSGGGAVSSVFGRTGAVVSANGDYSFSQISGVAAPAQLPVFTSTANGAVPAPGAATPATYVMQANGVWVAPATGGGVTSVAMTVPSGLAVAGSPITSSGTFGVTWSGTIPASSLPAPTTSTLGGVKAVTAVPHQWVASIDTTGTPQLSQPGFADLTGNIAVAQMNNGTGASATTFWCGNNTWATPSGTGGGTVNSVAMTVPSGLAVAGSPITNTGTLAVTWSGTIPATSLPNPSGTTLGGVQSATAAANNFMTGISTLGVPTFAQPSFANLSGTATAAQLPNPTTSAKGGVQAVTAVAHQWVNSISTSGVPTLTQPAFTDISGSVAASQMPALTGDVTSTAGTVATTIAAGAVTLGKMANLAANSVIGNNTGAAATPIALGPAQLTALNPPGPPAGTPPASPVDGQLYWDNVGGQLYVAYGGVWVAATCCAGGGGGGGAVTSVFGRTGAVVSASGDYSFSQINGVATSAQLPAPTTAAIGGVKAVTAVAHQWVASIDTTGAPQLSQPAFTDISGTVAATQLPAPTTAALGGVRAVTAVAHQWINSIATTGIPTLTQPAFTDISGTAAIAQVPTATSAQIQSNTASLVLDTDQTWGAVAPVSTATTGAITLNLSNGIHFSPSAALTGNVTFSFSNLKAGQCGIIALQAGSFTVSWSGTLVLPPAGTPAANTSGWTLYFYFVISATAGVAINKVL